MRGLQQTSLALVIFSAGIVSAKEKTPTKAPAPAPSPYCKTLTRWIDAAKTEFKSLRGASRDKTEDEELFATSASLPDALSCEVRVEAEGGGDVSCKLYVGTDPARARALYDSLIPQTRACLPGAPTGEVDTSLGQFRTSWDFLPRPDVKLSVGLAKAPDEELTVDVYVSNHDTESDD